VFNPLGGGDNRGIPNIRIFDLTNQFAAFCSVATVSCEARVGASLGAQRSHGVYP